MSFAIIKKLQFTKEKKRAIKFDGAYKAKRFDSAKHISNIQICYVPLEKDRVCPLQGPANPPYAPFKAYFFL